ncbi:hypothetical protein A1O1_06385 [Capronia coronata CBS 617.96]|uniref:Transcription factor domain-containing protein n=1 Tax=Capronia coronata CBS 617.96 TaxID=1182541 RepID=W9Y9U5_9EURO|nr:uncharacterized protein A1O1_06385 [Capronia coronata CBS 617.96]EXJ86016.1 hypothetical protein A1O1_06385 [Capronia coronata CBS 617.96]
MIANFQPSKSGSVVLSTSSQRNTPGGLMEVRVYQISWHFQSAVYAVLIDDSDSRSTYSSSPPSVVLDYPSIDTQFYDQDVLAAAPVSGLTSRASSFPPEHETLETKIVRDGLQRSPTSMSTPTDLRFQQHRRSPSRTNGSNGLHGYTGPHGYTALHGNHGFPLESLFSQSIPLTISAMPEDLSMSSDRMFLWSYFVHRSTRMFLCWDPQKDLGNESYQDPYTISLPAMAFESSPLRLAALALSAFQYGASENDERMMRYAGKLGLEASQALTRVAGSDLSSSHMLTTIVTAVFLFLLHPEFHNDVLPLARSAAACLANEGVATSVDKDCLSIAMHFLRWAEICAQCSLNMDVSLSSDEIHEAIEYKWWEISSTTSQACKDWLVHPFYGFSSRLINPLLKLARLVRRGRDLDGDVEDSDDLADDARSKFDAEVDALEELLLTCREEDLIADGGRPKENIDLLRLNDASYSAAVVLFYTRLRDLPWTAPFIRRHVKIIHDNIADIDPSSRVSLGIVFPLYVAACESVDLITRESIVSRLNTLPGYWYNRENQLVASLRAIWEYRDLNPGSTWKQWINGVPSSVANCIPV